jgi:hypothetical protein
MIVRLAVGLLVLGAVISVSHRWHENDELAGVGDALAVAGLVVLLAWALVS